MPDLGPVVGALAEVLGPLLAAFLRTTVGMFTFTVVLAVLAYRTAAASGSPGKAALAVVLVLGLGAVLGGVLAVKRALLLALRHGVARLQLGRRTLGALFARMLGVHGAAAHEAAGTRGGVVAQKVEQLPLARAEELLKDAVAGLHKEGGVAGFFRSRLHRMILDRVEALTLARFRAEGASGGGVDLIKVRDELSGRIDELLVGVFDKLLFKFTALICLALGGGTFLIALAIRSL
ncbi:MAG TPA: hypothetical protein PLW65_34140 [Pseudomonadota bacterium]|nr:hypothetical protein [Pseudomonadota bacterium]